MTIVLLPVVLASLTLTTLAVAVSVILRLRVERPMIEATLRAAGQLLAVGYLLTAATQLTTALWAVAWVSLMIAIGTFVLRRRSPIQSQTALLGITGAAFGLMVVLVGTTNAVLFGLAVFTFDPITFLVLSGLAIGNGVSAGASSLAQTHAHAQEARPYLEAYLALGASRWQTITMLATKPSKLTLIPQIERTRVTGLIALPGTMSGMLLAGADPLAAVTIQLLVVFLVLGGYALSALVMSITVGLLLVGRPLRLNPLSE